MTHEEMEKVSPETRAAFLRVMKARHPVWYLLCVWLFSYPRRPGKPTDEDWRRAEPLVGRAEQEMNEALSRAASDLGHSPFNLW